jgi:hypothetical protein
LILVKPWRVVKAAARDHWRAMVNGGARRDPRVIDPGALDDLDQKGASGTAPDSSQRESPEVVIDQVNTNREWRSPAHAARIVVAIVCSLASLGPAIAAESIPGMDEQVSALAPRAIAWAEQQSARVAKSGVALTPAQQELAREIGVRHPERIRLLVVDQFPLPQEADMRAAAMRIGLARPGIVGLTLGHSVLVRRGFQDDSRLLSHEFRHVSQYEARGGIPQFLRQHLADLARFGYEDSPFEVDARAHEVARHL